MARAAGLLLALAPALTQQAADAPFPCALPAGYGPFAEVPGDAGAWTASAGQTASFLMQYRLLESPGAKAELVARDLRINQWQANFGRTAGFSAAEWKGDWGGLPGAAGLTVRYQREKREMAALERIVIVHDRLVHFTWEGPAGGLAAAEACAASVRIPDAWIPPPPPGVDADQGLAPGTEAREFPWMLLVMLDLTRWSDQGVIEVGVSATPALAGAAAPDAAAWRLPEGAIRVAGAADECRYRLDPKGKPETLAAWGIVLSPNNDLAACDAAWLAVPDPGPGRFLPPAWLLQATHPGHMVLIGPDAAKPVYDESAQRSRTRFAAVPAGRSWPFFLAGRFEERLHAGIAWHLRKDAKALTPDLPAAAIARLLTALRAWLPAFQPRVSVVSFPGSGDRALPGLFVLDETREWFSQPADALLGAFTRRTWLARMAAASCFGIELRGSGNGAPVLENALAEYAAARLLEACDWQQDADALRAWWKKSEAAAGALPVPLTLLPAEDVLGSQRLLTAGAEFWTRLEARIERPGLDKILNAAVAAGRAWSTRDLIAAASRLGDPASAARRQSELEALLYTIP